MVRPALRCEARRLALHIILNVCSPVEAGEEQVSRGTWAGFALTQTAVATEYLTVFKPQSLFVWKSTVARCMLLLASQRMEFFKAVLPTLWGRG